MERASHAVGRLNGLEGLIRLGSDHYQRPEQWDIDVGSYAQRALEHGLKAVIAAHGARYERIHPLEQLLKDARKFVPDPSLRSNLAVLSKFAGGEVYGTPALEVGVDELLESVHRDVTDLLAICAGKANFDPWTVGRDDFQRGA